MVDLEENGTTAIADRELYPADECLVPMQVIDDGRKQSRVSAELIRKDEVMKT